MQTFQQRLDINIDVIGILKGQVWHAVLLYSSTGGVPCLWNDSIVFNPQACPFLRSSSLQTIVFQSGARIRRAPALAISKRLPPGSYTYKKNVCWMACLCGPVSMKTPCSKQISAARRIASRLSTA